MTEPSEPREEGPPENAPESEPHARPAQPDEHAAEAPTGAGSQAESGSTADTQDAQAGPADVAQPASSAGAQEPAAGPPRDESGQATSEASAAPEGGGQPSGEGEASAAPEGGGEQAAQAPKKKKKRRRKKRKKKAAEGEGDDKSGSLPFMAYFGSGEGRKHAFSVGEIVAGRVESVTHGVFIVDLFGKARAIADEHEPHEVPVQPPADAPQATVAEGAPAAPGPTDAAQGLVSGEPSEGQPAPLTATAAEKADVTPPPAEETGSPPVTGAAGATAPDSSPLRSEEPAAVSAVSPPPAPAGEGAPPAAGGEAGQAGVVAGEPAPAGEHTAPLTATTAEKAEVAQPQPAAPSAEQPSAEQPPAEPAAPPPEVPLEPEGAEPPAPGSIFRGRVGAVAESGHIALINRLIDREAVKATVAKAQEEKRRVPGIVFGFNRGGFDVVVGGLRAFCPASGMSLEPIDDPHGFVGRKLEFTLPPNKGGAGLVVSRRGILEREQRKRIKQRLKAIQPGHRLVGHVTSVRDFGAFVDLGEGLEGMIHVSELSWQRDVRPQDVVKVGDEVVVRVLEVKPGTRKERHGRVSLSMRAVEPDPWDAHAEELATGAPRRGRVVRTTDFGAFVELAPGIDGLLHISELGKDLSHASQAVKEGDELDVVIDRVDRKQRRISLSKLTPMELELVEKGELDLSKRPRSLKPGSHITVLVDRVEHGGVVVKVQGVLGRRGRGFIPNRELQAPEGGVDRKSLQPGHPIDVKIIGTDRDGGLRCSVRGRHLDEERQAVREYRKEASKKGLGTFGDLLRAKLEQDRSSDGS